MDISKRTDTFSAEDRSWLGSSHGTEATRSITLDKSAFADLIAAGADFEDGIIPSGFCVARLAATGLYAPYRTANTAGITTDDVTPVWTITRTATGGTVNLIVDGLSSDDVPVIAATTNAELQTAIRAIHPDFAAFTVTGSAGGPFTFTGVGRNADLSFAIDDSDATGGTVVVAVGTAGAAGTEGTLAGHLFSSVDLSKSTVDVGAALLEHGIVIEANLPDNSGLDDAGKSDVAGRIHYR